MLLKISLVLFFLGVTGIVSNLVFKPEPVHPFDVSRYQKNTTKQSFPLVTSCANHQVGYLHYQGKVRAHPDVVKLYKLSGNNNQLVLDQLKFIDGFLDFSFDESLRFVPHREKNYKITRIKKVPYPLDVSVLDKGYHGFPEGFFGKTYKQNKSSLEIEYEAQIKVTRCFDTSQHTSYQLVLPLDPYLAYWYVPTEKRVELAFSPLHKKVTTPCAASMMAELVNPSMYWNVWKPKSRIGDFSCEDFLKNDIHVHRASASFVPIKAEQKPVDYSALEKKEKIKISVIGGLLLPHNTLALLEKARPHLLRVNQLSTIKFSEVKDLDVAVLSGFSLIELMPKIAEHSPWTVEDHKDHFILKTAGRLLHSKKSFELSFYLGPTVEYQEGRKHWSFLAQAMRESDLIFYSGHAGMGTAFTVPHIKERGGLKDFLNSPDYQLITILSCSSISYFGDDVVAERSKLGKVTDLALTGFDNHAYRITPAMIQFIDLSLAHKDYDLESMLTSHLQKGEDLHISRY